MTHDQFHISGGRVLQGELQVNGAKNHALKMIPAALLVDGPTTLENVPDIEDVSRLLEIVEEMGATVKRTHHTITITPPSHFSGDLSATLVPTLRASVVIIGPALTRYKRVHLPHPGGDNIGQRPINFFVEGLRAMGAVVEQDTGGYTFTAPTGLTGGTIVFPTVSVTGTETIMMAAVCAQGSTVMHNAALEPEIVALASFLNEHGAHITGAGTSTVVINGTGLLRPAHGTIIPDRLEAGSFLMLAAATNSAVTITQCRPEHLTIPITLLQQMGVRCTTTPTSITVEPTQQSLSPLHVVTHEYPGFPTDLQPPLAVLLTQAQGRSTIHETIWESRLGYLALLQQMGANSSAPDACHAVIEGPTVFHGTTIESPDIRAGIAVIIAALLAEGDTTIHTTYQIDRGYERIEQRLQSIGAAIQRITT